jgi:ADP-ribosylglycohydrolase
MNDKIRAMFLAAALGDALGVPHERATVPYTGKLEHKIVKRIRFSPNQYGQPGQVSDDTEMAAALMQILKENNMKYDADKVVLNYMKWANSGNSGMGKNTRALLHGIKTLNGYKARYAKILLLPLDQRSQSNGTLMRCYPLAILEDDECIKKDVALTNPHPFVEECEIIYVHALRRALTGCEKISIMQKAIQEANLCKDVLLDMKDGKVPDLSHNKGWIGHGLFVAFYCLLHFDSYTEAMKWIIEQPYTDTDTNASIAGALWGAYHGLETLKQEQGENIGILINCTTEDGQLIRPHEYRVSHIGKLYGL